MMICPKTMRECQSTSMCSPFGGCPSDQINRQKQVMDLIPADWDKKPVSLAYEIEGFLQSVKDQGTAIDSGTNGVTGDLWVTVQGVEYFITIVKSNAQLRKEGAW